MSSNIEELDKTVKSMMETSENMFPMGKKKTRGRICKVCRKEGHPTDIMRHIEAYHLEGIAISCNFCGKILKSRHTLRHHIKVHHTQQISFNKNKIFVSDSMCFYDLYLRLHLKDSLCIDIQKSKCENNQRQYN